MLTDTPEPRPPTKLRVWKPRARFVAQGCERLWKEQTSALGPRNALEEVIAFAVGVTLLSS